MKDRRRKLKRILFWGLGIILALPANLIIVRNGERYGIKYDEWLWTFFEFAGRLGQSLDANTVQERKTQVVA